MARSVNASTLAALQSDNFRFCHLIKLSFSTPVYITDYTHDIVYGINTYEAGGHLIRTPDPQETRDLRVNAINIDISSVDRAYLSIFLNQDWLNREVTLYKAVIGTDGQIVGDPINIFQGLMSQFQLDEGPDTSTISLRVASHWADFQRKNGRITNNNSQQYFFPSDLGMEFSANIVKDIKWGKP